MEFEDIESISIIYGKNKRMKEFINPFHEFWERDGKQLQILRIRKHSWFNELRKFIWKGD